MSKIKKKKSSDKKVGTKNKSEKKALKAKTKVATKKDKKDKKDKGTKKSAKPIAKKKIAPKKNVKLAKPKKARVAAKPVKKVAVKSKAKAPAPKKSVSKTKAVKVVTKKAVKKPEPKKVTKSILPKKAKVKKPESSKKKEIPAGKAKPVVEVQKHVPAKEMKPVEKLSKKALAAERANEVLAVSNTIPLQKRTEISHSKIASISSSITNPIRTNDSYSIRPDKEPRGKYELEFVIHASVEMLFEFISTPSGLSEWFCDNVNIRNGIYTFIWDEQIQQARLLKNINLEAIRFQWVDKTDGSYFELKIQKDEITNEVSLIVIDFADTNAEREEGKRLWNNQVERLMQVIGAV